MGLIVIIVFAELMVAEKAKSEPFSSVSFSVIKLPTLELVNSELSRFLTASEKVNVMSESVAMDAVITASIETVGGNESPVVKVAEAAVIALL